MDKAPEPSPWGLIAVICLLGFLIWLGPIIHEDKEQIILPEISVQGVDCSKDLDKLTVTQIEICADLQL